MSWLEEWGLSQALEYVGEFFSNEVQVNQSPPPISGYAGCIYSSEKMEGWLQHLRHALCLGDPAWPRMESQAKEAIQSLEDMAKAFVWGQTNDWSIVKCFMEQGGLAILCEALLTYALPWSIKMQVYQSFCMVVQNAKDEVFEQLLQGPEVNNLLLGDPEIDTEEYLQYFLSFLKTLALRVKPDSMHLLIRGDDYPLMRRAVKLAGHSDQMVRTQARAAYLTLLRCAKDGHVLDQAIEVTLEMLPELLGKLLWSQWSAMAQAAKQQNAGDFRAAALDEEDTFEHIAELMQLGLPEITEVVGGVIACALLSRLGCFVGSPIEHAVKAEGQMWEAKFMDMYADVSESLIIPSPKSGVASMSEDSTEDSTEVSLRKDLWLSSVDDDATCPAFVGWVVSEKAKQMHANPFDAALALRSLASFTKIFREANLGGVVMPFMELLTLPFVPSALINSIRQLQSGQYLKDLAVFCKDVSAAAMEDLALRAWSDDNKVRLEHWRNQLRSAPGLCPQRLDLEVNPLRSLLSETPGLTEMSQRCNIASIESVVNAETAACILVEELQALYPFVLEDAGMIEPHVEPTQEVDKSSLGAPGHLESFADSIFKFFNATGFGEGQCSLIASL